MSSFVLPILARGALDRVDYTSLPSEFWGEYLVAGGANFSGFGVENLSYALGIVVFLEEIIMELTLFFPMMSCLEYYPGPGSLDS